MSLIHTTCDNVLSASGYGDADMFLFCHGFVCMELIVTYSERSCLPAFLNWYPSVEPVVISWRSGVLHGTAWSFPAAACHIYCGIQFSRLWYIPADPFTCVFCPSSLHFSGYFGKQNRTISAVCTVHLLTCCQYSPPLNKLLVWYFPLDNLEITEIDFSKRLVR